MPTIPAIQSGSRPIFTDWICALANAIDWILGGQQTAANAVEEEKDKKAALSRFQDLVLALGKAFALAAASDTAREIKNEVGFFQAVRAAMVKPTAKGGLSQRNKEMAISPEELAFYDALSDNDSAVDVLGNEQLRIIANVLVEQLQKNVTVDWHLKDSARAKLRILVKRILKKFGYPPDLEANAIATVISQAEMLLRWQS